MTRKSRYHVPGAFYHVMLRGNDGQEIFFSDADRCRMCLLIQQGVERYGHRIHAFCFMSNHIHLLLQVGDIHISKIMHNLAFRYSQKTNRQYSKIGHLFQGRFKACLVEETSYFLRLLRYIHMNPVRAGLVKIAALYSISQSRKLTFIRGAIVMHAFETGVKLEEMASVLKRDGSTLSRIRSRFCERYQNCIKTKKQIEQLRLRSTQLTDLQT